MRLSRLEKLVVAFIILQGAVVVTVLVFGGLFVSEQAAVKALEDQGFNNVQVVDHAWFAIGFRGGGRGDAARFTAKAVNPAGKEVTIYVFVGWPFKGSTVRSM